MRWSLVAAVNDEHVLQTSLLRSPDLSEALDVVLKRGFASAGEAYNAGLCDCRGDIVVFAHQDVYFPPGWIHQLERQIEHVERVGKDWGVIGVCGTDLNGSLRGYLYSTGLKGIYGEPLGQPVAASSIDEMVIVIRRNSGLSFDSSLPGFHLYGTDICLQARRLSMSNFVISALCVHNSNGLKTLPWAFWRSYWSLRSKWRLYLPIVTTCTTIYPDVFRAGFEVSRGIRGTLSRSASPGRRVDDPASLYRALGQMPDSERDDGSEGTRTGLRRGDSRQRARTPASGSCHETVR